MPTKGASGQVTTPVLPRKAGPSATQTRTELSEDSSSSEEESDSKGAAKTPPQVRDQLALAHLHFVCSTLAPMYVLEVALVGLIPHFMLFCPSESPALSRVRALSLSPSPSLSLPLSF